VEPLELDEEGAGLLPTATAPSTSSSGLTAAVLAGLVGGLLLFPMRFSTVQGLAYLPSMGVGVALALPLPLVLDIVMPVGQASRAQHKEALLPGLASGVVWNIGNACSMVAVKMVCDIPE
jgi:hypothetical protein